ncbi:APH(3') family aminoglycoside O-phosphotransferase [uncultured Sphingomonas sp.]|uniref:APH(3') family aminoglycoside O-phosphotransferase n=1 Tax=uncultured Sphingomonas sp. TaxID=158754 RepID=UPI0025CE9FE1|nr:APH(3') family aminoglycoside O-phosphotransferase [uncultured Sphingomonas sp.]
MSREAAMDPVAVPPGLAAAVAGGRWFRDTVGESGCAVFRLAGDAGDDLYLKAGRGAQLDDLVDEMVRLRWLAGRLPVPQLHAFLIEDGAGWLLTGRIPGRTAYQILEAAPEQAPALAESLGKFLRRLHDLPAARCPFNADHRLRLAAAKDRLDAGLVAEDEFDEARQGMSAQAVWDEMLAALPPAFDRVVTHGDFSLDNLFVEGGAVSGCIDLGRVGIADPWQDLAILWHSLAEFGEEAPRRMLAAYGTALDPAQLDFHLRLDEFF